MKRAFLVITFLYATIVNAALSPFYQNANQLQGNNVAATAPTNNQVLTWNSVSGTWRPQSGGGGGVTFPLNAGILGSASDPVYQMDDTDSGMYSTGDGNVSFSANGFLRLQVDQTETTVTGPLEVTGDISAANYPPTGTASRVTYYDGTGNLAASLWQLGDEGMLYLNADADTALYRPFYMDITNNETASDDMVSIGVNNAADVTDDLQQLYLNSSGDIGGDYFSIQTTNTGNVGGGLTLQSLYNNGTFGGQFRAIDAANGIDGTGAGGIFANLGNQAAMSGDWTMLNVYDSGEHTDDQQMVSIFASSNITGNRTIINASAADDVSGNVNMLNLGYNGTPTIGGNYLGANIYNSAVITGNALGVSISEGSDADGKTGLSVSVSGESTDYVTGLSVSVDGATAVGQKVAANIGGGAFSANSPTNSSEFTFGPGFQNNSLGGVMTIADGSPLTGVFGFGNTLAVNIFAYDNMTADNLLGSSSFGFSVNGFVNQLAVTSGHTIDTINYMAAGGQFPVESTGGTVTNLSMFRALGIVSGGGSLNVTNLWGFKVESTLCGASPTNCWGVYVADPSASNYFAGEANADKGFRLSTSGSQPSCDSAHRGLMWNVEGGTGVADELQVCLKDAADAYGWVSVAP